MSRQSDGTARGIGCVFGIIMAIFIVVEMLSDGGSSSNSPSYSPVKPYDMPAESGFMTNTPDQNADVLANQLTSTPEGAAMAHRLADKDDQLTAFQRMNDISDDIAEAAIREWVTTHNGNFDWDLEDVKAICLRRK